MESIQCPACRVRVARRPGVVTCPGCGARLRKSKPAAADDEAPERTRKKKRKKARPGPNYALWVGLGGGFVFAVLIAWGVALALGSRKPSSDTTPPAGPGVAGGPNGTPGQPVADAGPAWEGKADPPKVAIRPKDDLSIALQGEPLFPSGQAPFVADLVPVVAGGNGPPLSVYDLRTGQRTVTAKAIPHAERLGRFAPNDAAAAKVALGPDGKSLATKVTTETGKGRQRSVTTEGLVYRLGQDAPVARLRLPQWVSWMEFGRDDNQLLVLSVTPMGGFSATAYDLKQSDQPGVQLEIARTPIRWRNGFSHPEALAVSPGRNYLAVGEGRGVDLVRLSDGKSAGRFPLPGDCVSVAFSADGKELTAHTAIAPPRGARTTPTQYQWTTFSLADGKQVAQNQAVGGPTVGPLLAAGPKPGQAVHADRDRVVVTDTRYGAPAYSAPVHAVRSFDADRLLVYDAREKQVVARRIDPDQLAAGETELDRLFGPRPAVVAADRTGLAAPTAPAGWNVPVDAAGNPPTLVNYHEIKGGADFVMPWTDHAALSALSVRRVDTPRDRYALQWNRVDLTTGQAEPPIDLWPSLLPPGQVPAAGFGGLLADHTADGSKIAVRDEATPARVDVWDKSGKRLLGFLPYGPETPVESLVWTADNRLVTRGGGKTTGWEIPGPKAVFELSGYAGAHVLSPGRKWIGLQYQGNLDIYDTATGKPLGRAEQANPGGKPWHGFAVSRDGLQLAAVELVRGGDPSGPAVWAFNTWDLRTGRHAAPTRLFGGAGGRAGDQVMWLGPRQLLAGGADVIDLDLQEVTATVGLTAANPLASPDGRYWGARSNSSPASGNRRMPLEAIMATGLDDVVRSLPRLAPADIVFREGATVEVVSQTGDNGRDAVARSLLGQVLAAEGYGTGRSDWRLVVSGQRANSTASLETPAGGKIPIPFISGKVQFLDPTGAVVLETPASGGFDMNHSKYKTGKEDLGPMGGSITHFNFGFRDPGDAMAEEAWENFMTGVKSGNRFPRVLARVNGKVVPLPIQVPVPAK